MPPSRYVSADRMLGVVTYLAVAVAVLIAGDFAMRALGSAMEVRRVFAVIWLVALPVGGWWVWRRRGH